MKIGYAMYSARDLTTDAASMKRVLKSLADMGYEGVEFFLYNGIDPVELKETLSRYGLEAIGTHVHKPRWDNDTQGELDFAVKAGINCLTYPWIDPDQRTESAYRSLPAYLTSLAARCKEHDITLQYHNHDFEFEKLGDTVLMDYLLQSVGPLAFELDTFWAQYAGVNAVQYMAKWKDRISSIHIKDYLDVEGENKSFCAIGAGKLDNSEVIHAAKAGNLDWLIVELDNSPLDPLESARISIESIKKML